MNVLSSAPPWDMVAQGYSVSAMSFFEQYSSAALDILPVSLGDRVADIACGPGTLALQAAATGAQVIGVDFSLNMLAHLEKAIADLQIDNLQATHGDGQSLLFEDDTFDAAFSMFALMFYPDRKRGFRELYRVVRPGGGACVATFSTIEKSPLLRHLFAVTQTIAAARQVSAYDVDSLENPKMLAAEMVEAGFSNVRIHPVVRELGFSSAEEFVTRMADGSAPMQLLKLRLDYDDWQARIGEAITFIEHTTGPFPRAFGATALLAVGYK